MRKIHFCGHVFTGMQWTGENLQEVLAFAGKRKARIAENGSDGTISMRTPLGIRDMNIRDWICRKGRGELWIIPGCELCGAPPSSMIRDSFRVENPEGRFAKHEPDGPPHWFCSDHERPPQETRVRPELVEMLNLSHESSDGPASDQDQVLIKDD